MKKALWVLVVALVGLSSCSRPQLKEGDIIFQTSKAAQSKFLVAGTGSLASHCGIIVEREDGLYVYEAKTAGDGLVALIPLDEFIDKGVMNIAWYRRVTEEPLKVRLDYEGQEYDYGFEFDNGKMYCSELVYLIYKEQFGIELCKPRTISEFNVGFSFAQKFLEQRGIPLDRLAVPPVDIQDSPIVYRL